MGGCVSCILKCSKPPKANLFDTNGQLHHLELPITAAELMLEEPGTIVCSLDEIRRSHRLWAMKADEQLQAGKFYLMVPAQRLCGKISEKEISVIENACKKKGTMIGSKVSPSVEGDKEEEEVEEEEAELKGSGFQGHRFRTCKQWRPMLEPIHEGF